MTGSIKTEYRGKYVIHVEDDRLFTCGHCGRGFMADSHIHIVNQAQRNDCDLLWTMVHTKYSAGFLQEREDNDDQEDENQ